MTEAVEATACWVDHGIEKAMNTFNKKLAPDANPKGEHPAQGPKPDGEGDSSQ